MYYISILVQWFHKHFAPPVCFSSGASSGLRGPLLLSSTDHRQLKLLPSKNTLFEEMVHMLSRYHPWLGTYVGR